MVKAKEQTVEDVKKSRWKPAMIKLVILLALVSAGYGMWQNPQIVEQMRAWLQSKPQAEEMVTAVDYQAQINDLRNQVQALQMRANAPLPENADFTAMNEKLASLEKNNLNIIDSKADVATVLGLLTRLDKAEQKLENMVKITDEGALILTATMLVKDSAERGGNFEYEMEVLQQLAANNANIKESIAVMSRYAQEGILPVESLDKEFTQVYKLMLKEQKANFEKTWKDRINSKLGEIVKIKRVNEKAPKFAVNAGLEKAKVEMKSGNVAGAVSELERPANAELLQNEALKMWLEKAKARVAFEQAVAKISASSLAMLKVNFIKAVTDNK